MKSNELSEIRTRLTESLDVAQIRFGLWFLLVIYGALLAIFAIGPDRATAVPVMAVLMGLIIDPAVVYELIQLGRIYREPEEYIFCKAELCQPRHAPWTRGCFTFCAVIETEREGRFLVETQPIFLSHGFGGPLMEDYVGKTVTLAWNRETETVVVIG